MDRNLEMTFLATKVCFLSHRLQYMIPEKKLRMTGIAARNKRPNITIGLSVKISSKLPPEVGALLTTCRSVLIAIGVQARC